MKIIKMMTTVLFAMVSSVALASELVGSVDVGFKLLGPNNKINITVFDDPEVKGVACYLSSSKMGGVSGAIGISSDSSDASVACRKTGSISFDENIKNGQEVFSAKRSLVFKELHVVRFVDRERKMIVYLTYSDHLIDGSPKNSITAVSYGTE